MRAACSLLLLAVLTGSAYGQKAQPSFKEFDSIRVKISYGTRQDPDPIVSSLISKMGRFFRDFKDVILTDADPHLVVHVVAYSNDLKDGRPIGYTIAVAVVSPVRRSEAERLSRTEGGIDRSLGEYYKTKQFFEDLYLETWPKSDLDAHVQALVERIDVENVEPLRKIFQSLKTRQ